MNFGERCIERTKAGGQRIFRRENPDKYRPCELAKVRHDQSEYVYQIDPDEREDFLLWVKWNFLDGEEMERFDVRDFDLTGDNTLVLNL